MSVNIEVLGPEPACVRCRATLQRAFDAAAKLSDTGIVANVEKRDINADEIIDRYGIVGSPAVVINGRVVTSGRIPAVQEIVQAASAAAGAKA